MSWINSLSCYKHTTHIAAYSTELSSLLQNPLTLQRWNSMTSVQQLPPSLFLAPAAMEIHQSSCPVALDTSCTCLFVACLVFLLVAYTTLLFCDEGFTFSPQWLTGSICDYQGLFRDRHQRPLLSILLLSSNNPMTTQRTCWPSFIKPSPCSRGNRLRISAGPCHSTWPQNRDKRQWSQLANQPL